ncbi:MAG TPA: hypothetical protein VLI92_03400 [Candidatus Saccharimonadales bacterium]|nr:hypothetical protein [Candidatus Saccharimonadales bacterium]
MKILLRVFVFTVISIIVTQKALNSLDFSVQQLNLFLLLAVALSLLNLFSGPIFKLISLPSEGIGLWILSFLLTAAMLFVLSIFIPAISFKATTVGNLLISSVMIPSKSLTSFWSLVASALLFSSIYRFFSWLSKSK